MRAHEATLHTFFDAQGPVRCKLQQLVSADAASYIANVVKERCPNAVLCLDPFHIVKWATEARDEVRGEVWNQLRRDCNKEQAQYPSWVDVRPEVGGVPAADTIARVCKRAQITRQVYTWSNPK